MWPEILFTGELIMSDICTTSNYTASADVESLEQYFLTNSPVSRANYHAATSAAQAVLLETFAALK